MVSPVTGDMTASCRRGWTAEQAYGSLSQRYFPVGPRALERWPLQYHIVNRRALDRAVRGCRADAEVRAVFCAEGKENRERMKAGKSELPANRHELVI